MSFGAGYDMKQEAAKAECKAKKTHLKCSLGPTRVCDMLEMRVKEWAELPTPQPCQPQTEPTTVFQVNKMPTAQSRLRHHTSLGECAN